MGPLLFSQYVKGTHGTRDRLKRVVLLERVQRFRRVRPLVAGGTPCRPFLLPTHLGDKARRINHWMGIRILLILEMLKETMAFLEIMDTFMQLIDFTYYQ